MMIAVVLLLGGCWPLCEDACGDGRRCIDGFCVDDPCRDRNCGPDGYGGSCGSCDGLCQDGSCRSCPLNSVRIGGAAVCIDRYEASRDDGDVAKSQRGVSPWSGVSFDEAKAACVAAGKRLCRRDEWVKACTGGTDCGILCIGQFPYGEGFKAGACHADPFPSKGFDEPTKTGSLPSCEGGYPGIFDMSGNVREWIDNCSTLSCDTIGGSYDSQTEFDLTCGSVFAESTSSSFQTDPDIGFRCCTDL